MNATRVAAAAAVAHVPETTQRGDDDQTIDQAAPVDESVISVTCDCGAELRVKIEWAGRHRKCRRCSQPVLIPMTETAENARDAMQLRQTVEAAIQKLPASPTVELKKTLSAAKFKKLTQQLVVENPLDQAGSQRQRMALIELGDSRDVRAFDVMAPFENDAWDHVRAGLVRGLGMLGDPRGMPILLRGLVDRSTETVQEAVKALRNSQSEQAVRPLIRLGLTNPQWKMYVTEAIAHLGPVAVPALLDVVQHRDPGMLLDAVVLLGKIGDASAVPTLLQTVDHTKGATRAFTIEALGRIGDKQAVSKLLQHLDEPDEVIRLNAIVALGKIQDSRAVRPLLPFLRDPDVDLQLRALDALGQIADPRAVPAILQLMPDADESLREAIFEALTKIGDVTAVDALLPMLDEAPTEVQAKILLAVKKAKASAAVPVLLELLNHSKPIIRRHAVDALGEIGRPETCELVGALVGRDPAFEVRAAAVKALGKIGNKQALPILERALRDESAVRCGAVMALGMLGDSNAIPALLAMLRDDAPEVRYHSLSSLGKLGAKSAIGAIQALLEDRDPMVQGGAEKALEVLGSGRPKVSLGRKLGKLSQRFLPDSIAGALPGKSLLAGMGAVAAVLGIATFLMSGANHISASAPPQQGFVDLFAPLGADSQLALTRSRGELEVWDVATGKLVKATTMEGRGQLLSLGGRPGVAQIAQGRILPWDYETTDSLSPTGITLGGGMIGIQMSDDGKVAFATTRTNGFTWDISGNKKLCDIPCNPRSMATLCGDGQFVVMFSIDRRSLQWLNAATGEVTDTVEIQPGEVSGLCVSPSAEQCLIQSVSGLTIVSRSSGEKQELAGTTGLTATRFADRDHVAALFGDKVAWISLATKKVEQFSVTDAEISVTQMAPLRSGKHVAVAAESRRQFWVVDTTTGKSTEVK